MKRFELILKRETGLNAAAAGMSFLRRAVNARMRAVGLSNLEAYHQFLIRNEAERHSLIEEAVVPETWFFRDRSPFEMLAQMIVDEWLPTHPRGKARLLSLPCSTGEEPYSMVMALKEARVPDDRYVVEAVDISENVLKRARSGIYRENSFRGKEHSYRARYFKSTVNSWVIDPSIRRKVTFLRGNLLDERFIRGLGLFDFIFCRNLLIYFDDAERAKAARHLHRMLMKNGLCYFSAVEVPLVLGSGFAQAGSSMTFACRKELLPSQVRFASDVIPRETNGSRGARRQGPARAWTPSANGEDSRDDLQDARRLAEIGDWQGAIRKCEQHLSRNTLCSDGYFLLGRLFDVLGEESRAIEAFRRVLFLQPDHYESIRRLAIAAQQEGNLSRAQALNRRAERLRPSNPQDDA